MNVSDEMKPHRHRHVSATYQTDENSDQCIAAFRDGSWLMPCTDKLGLFETSADLQDLTDELRLDAFS